MVEAVVSVDERGQMVLPKDVRVKLGLEPGEKLAIATWQAEGEVCCALLIKTRHLTGAVEDLLGPLANAVSSEAKGS